jgi:gliding motility-associated protein GldM
MSGGKQTPRQAMIGLMYLVLLAMLAMNASKDLLNAFVMLEKGIDKTVGSFSQTNSGYYETIAKAAASSPSAYAAVDKEANEVKKLADEVVDLIALHKVQLISVGDLKTIADTAGRMADYLDGHGIPLQKDNQDFGAQFYMVDDAGANGIALAGVIDGFLAKVVSVLNNDGDPSNDYLVERYEKLFDTSDKVDAHNSDGPKTSFAARMSEHMPLASVTANLSLWQSYIRNAEADVIGSIASKMDGEGMVVDKAQGLVQFENGYVLKGDTVRGQIFLAAYNSKSDPNIYLGVPDTNLFNKNGGQIKFAPGVKPKLPIIGKSTKLRVSNGKGVFSAPTNEVGVKTLTGVVEVISAKGTFYYLYNSEYMVAEPTATIAATAMNVFYVGVDNPVSISAPGVSLDEIEIRGGGVSFRKGKKAGEYIARASKANPRGTEISVFKKGGSKLGGMKFRIKRLPDPAATILNQKEGLISKGKLRAATFLKAQMENFDFDVKVSVKQFKMTISIGGDLKEFSAKGNKLTGPMKSILGKVKRGNRVYFEDIKVKLPDGTTRKVPSIILKVK